MAIGIFGGTFDPVHIGHLRTALELRDYLGLDTLHLMPCADPPHRETPMTPAAQRLAMLELAIAGEPGLVADDRELRRGGLSYTVDTLVGLRAERGAREPLYLCIGMDSLATLDTWHRWRELTDHAHIVVAARPGWNLPGQGPVAEWLASRRVYDVDGLRAAPAGAVLVVEMTLLPVSATALRTDLAAGRSIRYLTPDPVIDYINSHGLYRPQ